MQDSFYIQCERSRGPVKAQEPQTITIRRYAMRCNAVQCYAMSCRSPHPIPARFSNRREWWESKPRKEKEKEHQTTRAAYCFGPGDKRRVHPSHPNPTVHGKRQPTNRHLMPEGKEPAKPRLRKKMRQFSKRSGHSARSSRKQSTEVSSTIMSCLKTSSRTAERLCAHAADTAAGLAHTGLALGAAPAGR